MPQQQEQAPCFLVIGIVFFVVGVVWFWPLAVFGGLFFIIGICIICQEQQKATAKAAPQTLTQPVAQPTPQPVAQPAPQPVAQPAPQSAPQPQMEQKFCPHCGAKTTGKYCNECGSEID